VPASLVFEVGIARRDLRLIDRTIDVRRALRCSKSFEIYRW